jgi:hypothetical protein
MAKKKASGTYFINRRVEFVSQGLYVAAIFLFIPAWFLGRELESRLPLFSMTLVAAMALFLVLGVPLYFIMLRFKVRPDAAKTFLAGFGFFLVPLCLGGLPVVNKIVETAPVENIRTLILTTFGEPGTEERVNLAGSSTALVEFEDGTRRRFTIPDVQYHLVKPRHSHLIVARKTGLFGLVWMETAAIEAEVIDEISEDPPQEIL